MSRFYAKPYLAVVALLAISLNAPISRAATSAPDVLDQSVFAFEFFTFARGETTMLEVFCEIPAQDFQFVKYAAGFYASYEISFVLSNSDGQPIARAVFVDSAKVRTFDQVDRRQPPHLVRFEFSAEPGLYTARIGVTDLETQRKAAFDKAVELPDYRRRGLALSDLQLANRITQAGKPGLLVKNSKKIVPNVRRVISASAENVYLYAEVYGLAFSQLVEGNFLLTYSILDADGVEIKHEETEMRTPGSATTLVIKIGLGAAEEGLYTINLEVEDLLQQQTARSTTSFRILSFQPNNI